MKPLKPVLALGCGLLLAAACASAQWRYRDYGDRSDRRDRTGNGIVERALRDLDSMRSQGYVDHHEHSRFEHARRDLLAFQDRWYRGRFDKSRLDGAIENLDHLARSRQVNPYDRRTLERDVWALRDFRAQGGSYGGWRSGWR